MFGRERLPALQPQYGRIGAEHGAIGEAEATGAVEHLPAPLAEGPDLQAGAQEVVTCAGVSTCGGHRDHLASGREFQHGFRVRLAHQGELLRAELQAPRQHKGLLACGWSLGGGGSRRGEGHLPGRSV